MRKRISRRQFIQKTAKGSVFAGFGGFNLLFKGCTTGKDYDVLITDGAIYDGLGNPGKKADIAIMGDRIVDIKSGLNESKAKKIIRANGLIVCPGFIDAHDHTSVELIVNPKAESAVRQGITTLVSGNCSFSPFPIADNVLGETKERLKQQFQLDLTWRDINGFFSSLEKCGISLNYSTLVGHGAVRSAAMGLNDRPPSPDEMSKMKELVTENIKNGAIGISSGLEYPPSSYAEASELVELAQVASHYDCVYATHMRDEGDQLLESLDESIEVARKTGVSLQISHFKVSGQRNWDKVDDALAKIQESKEQGIQIFCDRYPYIAGSTGLDIYFPLWAKQGTTEEFLARLKDKALESKLRAHLAAQEERLGSWDKVIISSVATDKNKAFVSKSVLRGAEETGKEPYEFMRDLLIEERGIVEMVSFSMKEENLKKIIAHPLVGIGCDGSAIAPYGLLGSGKPHPRHYGTFPRVLGRYIREEKILPMPEMLKKMTSLPAKKFGFADRGALKMGNYADIAIFDESRVIDKATWTEPHQYPEGIEYVLVNGKVIIERGEHTGELAGRILKSSS